MAQLMYATGELVQQGDVVIWSNGGDEWIAQVNWLDKPGQRSAMQIHRADSTTKRDGSGRYEVLSVTELLTVVRRGTDGEKFGDIYSHWREQCQAA